jgi:hypothetical protein
VIADEIDASRLNEAQLDGRACVRCGGQDAQPMVPLYNVIAGSQLFAHVGACPAPVTATA